MTKKELKQQLIRKRFREELDLFKSKKGIQYDTHIQSMCPTDLGIYYREAISKFANGQRKLTDYDFSNFAKAFGIRKEYLACEDNFRTQDDKNTHDERFQTKQIHLHKLFVSLGYIDTIMELEDYQELNVREDIDSINLINAFYFTELLKDEVANNGAIIICDVKTGKFNALLKEEYDKLMDELLSLFEFRLNRINSISKEEYDNLIKDLRMLFENKMSYTFKDAWDIPSISLDEIENE